MHKFKVYALLSMQDNLKEKKELKRKKKFNYRKRLLIITVKFHAIKKLNQIETELRQVLFL